MNRLTFKTIPKRSHRTDMYYWTALVFMGSPLYNWRPHPKHTRDATSSMPHMWVLRICVNTAEGPLCVLRPRLLLLALDLLQAVALQVTAFIKFAARLSLFAELFEVIYGLHCIVIHLCDVRKCPEERIDSFIGPSYYDLAAALEKDDFRSPTHLRIKHPGSPPYLVRYLPVQHEDSRLCEAVLRRAEGRAGCVGGRAESRTSEAHDRLICVRDRHSGNMARHGCKPV